MWIGGVLVAEKNQLINILVISVNLLYLVECDSFFIGSVWIGAKKIDRKSWV